MSESLRLGPFRPLKERDFTEQTASYDNEGTI